MKTVLTLAILIVSVIGLSGCGSSAGLYPVTGSVIYQGKPATGAAVHFHLETQDDNPSLAFPIGLVDADGNFELQTGDLGKGALPGRYKVLVRWPNEKNQGDASPTTKGSAGKNKDPKNDSDRLNFRYYQASKPLLTAEVKAEKNKLEPFELKD